MKSKRATSFKKEILICLILLSLLPTLISDTVLIQVVKTTIENADKRKATEQSELISDKMQHYVSELDEAAKQIVSDSMIYTGVDASSKWKAYQIYVSLYEKSASLREYADFNIYDNMGVCRYTTLSSATVDELPVYWGILSGVRDTDALAVRSVAKTGREDEVLLQLGREILDEQGIKRGNLIINISRSQLEAYLGNALPQQYGIAIMDRFWEEIYSSELATGEDMIGTLRKRRMEGVHLTQDSDAMMLSISEVSGINLYVAVGVPKIFHKDIAILMFLVMVVISAVSLILCFLIAESMSHDLSLPISRLSQAMNRLKEGDLDIQVDTTREDELGQLTRDFNHMTRRLKKNVEMQLQQQEQINAANIAMMQAQLNPHFLYNTLDTMKWIAKANGISELVTLSSGLAKILRMSISSEQFVTLQAEIKMVESYVDIQKIRFRDKFACDIELPMELEDQIVPKLILQPIVENAIRHGLHEREEGRIFINIYEKNEELIIEVEDNGLGIDAEVAEKINSRRLQEQQGHIGLRNVDSILCLHYGEQYGVHVEKIVEGGTRVTLKLPCKEKRYVESVDSR